MRFLANITFFFGLFCSVLVTGCIMNPAGMRAINLVPKPYTEVPTDNKSAVVTFYREDKFAGAGTSFYIRDKNGKSIGGMIAGSYFSVRLAPGVHTFTTVTA